MRVKWATGLAVLLAVFCLVFASDSLARNPIRNAFFNVYTLADTTRIGDLDSNANHCGACHFDFDGGGPRNPYGLAVEVAINSGNYPDNEAAILSLDGIDSDNDGFVNNVEITDRINFTNTPTFPGLTIGNIGTVSNVDTSEISGHLTPSGSTDTTPPVVTVLTPNGGENYPAMNVTAVTWTATDASGISHVDMYFSDDNGVSFRPVARTEADDGTWDWFVPNRPGTQNIFQVVARDSAGNYGSDGSDATFTITGTPAGLVPTTMRDMDLPGTQPLESGTLEDPDVSCVTCHGNYDTAVEPWYNWKGTLMGQAMRDPLFLACLAIAEQDAPSVGDLCLRCHTPGGWQEGRSVDTGGGQLTAVDRQGVQCDFCHRAVDPIYEMGISPPEDQAILDSLETIPLTVATGQFITDPDPIRRGPYDDAQANHAFLESPFHRESDICGTCHDVSNPVFEAGATLGDYVPTAFDAEHPDGDLRNMFPIERTYSEWLVSEYATTGVFAPEFAGNKPDGIVSSCQDCHMADASGRGAAGGPNRPDLPLHDLTGGNYFIADILPAMYPGEVDAAQMAAGKQRAIDMLQKAATMALVTGQDQLNPTLTVTITNEGAHKLPSGYPEGRRAWLNVKAWDDQNNIVYESGAYDASTGVLTHDADAKIYEIKPGISTSLEQIIGLPAGPSFHFVVNDTVYFDNRIPPRGFTNANFETIQSPPVGYSYADNEYWDATTYTLPAGAVFAEVTLNYQTTSKEYIEFLRDENVTNSAGQDLYDAWVAQGRCAPVAMVSDTTSLFVDVTGVGDVPHYQTALFQNWPNPFHSATEIRYALDGRQHATIRVYDVAGRLVRTLVDGERPAGIQRVAWDGTNSLGETVASGVYFYRLETPRFTSIRKTILLK